MLPRRQRLVHSEEFSSAVRSGVRVSSRHVVLHVGPGSGGDTRVGFVVSKAVGNAVRRNEVKRRLRHLMAARAERWPASSLIVVRALPAAAGASSTDLGRGLDRALDRISTGRPVA